MSMHTESTNMLQLNLKVQVLNPRPADEYRLLVYTARSQHVHAAFNVVCCVEQQKLTQVQFDYSSQTTPQRLHFVLFVNSSDDAGFQTQSLLGSGSVTVVSNGTCSTCYLMDVKDKKQAVLVLSCSGPTCQLQLHAGEQPQIATSHDSQTMIDQVTFAYMFLKHDINGYLNWVCTPMGNIPVLAFVSSVSSILTHAPRDHQLSDAFLSRMFAVAASNLGLPPDSFNACSPADQCAWVAEAVTLIPRASVYETDTVRDTSGQRPADQWAYLLSFPEPNIAAMDCEDSALLVLQLMYLLQHTNFTSPLLQAVQSFCKPYTACFVFGSLKKGTGATPHAYAALVDSTFLDGQGASTTAGYAPAVVLEGTARIGGAWKLNHATSVSTDSFNTHMELTQQLSERHKQFSRVLRSEATLDDVAQMQVYGPVFALISGDHRGQHLAKHWLLSKKGNTTAGVLPDQLWQQSSQLQLSVAVEYPDSRHSSFRSLCDELPRARIPFVEYAANQNLERPVAALHTSQLFHVDMHHDNYIRMREEVDSALVALGRPFACLTVALTDQLSVQQFWFASK